MLKFNNIYKPPWLRLKICKVKIKTLKHNLIKVNKLLIKHHQNGISLNEIK
jgi:hypothetical protein